MGTVALLLAACGSELPPAKVLVQEGPATEPGPDPDDDTAGQETDEPPPEEPPAEEPPAEEPPVEEPPADPLEQCPRVRVDVASGNTLNVRPGASTEGTPVGTLQDGQLATVIDIVQGETVNGTDTWYEVEVGPGSGFISGAYALCTGDAPPDFDGYRLPLQCGVMVRIAQGNFGAFSHSGRSRYAYDFSIPVDTPMVAMAPGVVSATHDSTGPGDPCYDGGGESCFPAANFVEVHHPDGAASIYKHLNRVDVSVGEVVLGGQVIGLSGSTGYSTGPHAHVMRQEACATATACESLQLTFLDVQGDGEPETDDWVTSGNCP